MNKIAALQFVVFLFVLSTLQAQDSLLVLHKELTLITENDNYNFTLRDRYYTNGFFIRFNWLAKTSAKQEVSKTIHRTEFGQMIFSPFFIRHNVQEVLATMDRPYTAWLYASYGETKFFNNGDVLLVDGSLGLIGPGAKGKEVQTGYHKMIGLYQIYGWEYQLNNEIGINGSVQYYRLLTNPNSNQPFSAHVVGKASLGNTFTNAAAGFLFKLGKMEQSANSSYWGGRLGKTTTTTENYFYLEPVLMAQAYNATVQGGLFRKDKGPFTSPLNPFLFLVKAGLIFSWKKAGFFMNYTLKQREAKSMIDKTELYGSFGLSFRFR